jgi:hypothetical protein
MKVNVAYLMRLLTLEEGSAGSPPPVSEKDSSVARPFDLIVTEKGLQALQKWFLTAASEVIWSGTAPGFHLILFT